MKYILATVIGLILGFGGAYLYTNTGASLGSVQTGSEYQQVTVSAANASGTAAVFGKNGFVTLGSVVVIQPASAGQLTIYDATTTTAFATSTGTAITGFSSANDVAGTYTFDVGLSTGLMLDATADFNGVYTVTFR